ncbi:Voltage-dependent calcium channel type A subunit alpha-1 [Diplonema papillatum]|nr:Voltage-dependent calcium channel type A subunit alpha-1 [Diplonema papillatum]
MTAVHDQAIQASCTKVEFWRRNVDAEEPLPAVLPRWVLHCYDRKDLDYVNQHAVFGQLRGTYNVYADPLFCISSRGSFRRRVLQLIDHVWFDRVIVIMIVLNCVAEILDAPSLERHEQAGEARYWMEVFFLAVFASEAAAKCCGQGFVLHRAAYLRSPWNVLDFLIITASFATVTSSSASFSVIRFVRIIRPLRVIRRARGIQTLIETVTSALPVLVDVLFILMIVIYVFAVIGLQLWNGSLHKRCYAYTPGTSNFILVADDSFAPCGGRSCRDVPGLEVRCEVHLDLYEQKVRNFDNVGLSMLLVLSAMSLDDWPREMFDLQDSGSAAAWAYFVALTLLGTYFLYHMVIAVLAVTYSDTQRRLSAVTSTVVDPAALGVAAMSDAVYNAARPPLAKPLRGDKQAFLRKMLRDTEGPHPQSLSLAARAEAIVAKYFGPPDYLRTYLQACERDKKRAAEAVEWDHHVSKLQEILETGPSLTGAAERREELRLIPATLRVDNLLGLNQFRALQAFACPWVIVPQVQPFPGQAPDVDSELEYLVHHSHTLPSETSKLTARARVQNALEHRYFEYCMLALTLVVVAAMSTDYYGISEPHERVIFCINCSTAGVFVLEVAAKLAIFGWRAYFGDTLNVVDFSATALAVPDIFYAHRGLPAIRALRFLRLLQYKGETERHLYHAVMKSVSALGSLLFLLILLIFMYSLLGVSLFEGSFRRSVLRESFDTLWEASIAVFVCVAGDGWSAIMTEAMITTSPWASIYFVTLFFFGTTICMLMFPAVLIDHMADGVRRRLQKQQTEALKQLHEMGVTMSPEGLSEAILYQNERDLQKAVLHRRSTKRTLLAASTALAHLRRIRQQAPVESLLENWRAEMSLKHNRPFWHNTVTKAKVWNNPCAVVEEDEALLDAPPGMNVQVWWCGDWHEGTVLGRREDGTYTILYRKARKISVGIDPSYVRPPRMTNPLLSSFRNSIGRNSNEAAPPVIASLQNAPLEEAIDRPDLGGLKLLWCALSDKGKRNLAAVWRDAERRRALLLTLSQDRTLDAAPQPLAAKPDDAAAAPCDSAGPPDALKRVRICPPAPAPAARQPNTIGGAATRAAAVGLTVVDEQAPRSTLYDVVPTVAPAKLSAMRLGTSTGGDASVSRSDATPMGELRPQGLSGKSLGVFGTEHPLRRGVSVVVFHRRFEDAMLVVVLANAVFLALDDRHAESRPGGKKVLDVANVVFVSLYLIEMCAKIVALGLWRAPNAYLKQTWNRVDAVVALAQVLELTGVTGVGTQFRGARTIRLLVRWPEIRVVCELLLRVLPTLMEVTLASVLIYFAFGCIGVASFKGRFSACTDPSVLLQDACVGTFAKQVGNTATTVNVPREWVPFRVNFDDMSQAALTLFELATLESWSDIMWRAADSSVPRKGPVLNANPQRAMYFITYVLVGHFYFVSLLLGTLVNAFHANQHQQTSLLTVKQRAWMGMQRLISRFNLDWKPRVPLHHEWNGLKRKAFAINGSKKFDYFIYTTILFNCLVMATAHYGMSEGHERFLHVSNIVFTAIFVCEALIRWAALGLKGYVRNPWNRFDFFCIASNVAGIVIGINTTALRVVRVLRGVRLLRKAGRLHGLLKTVHRNLPSLFNVSLLLLYIFFNWGIAGVSLFKNVKPNEFLPEHENFRTLPAAVLVLYQIATMESWTTIVEGASVSPPACEPELGNCGNRVNALIFFCTAFVVGSFVFLNLFTYAVLENFVETRRDVAGQSQRQFFEPFKTFKDKWTDADPSLTRRISIDEFLAIVSKLPEPLWEPTGRTEWLQVLRNLQSLPIPVSTEREVRFDDCMLALAMKAMNIRKSDAAVVRGTFGKISSFFDPNVFTLEHVIAVRRVEFLFHRWKSNREKKEVAKARAEVSRAKAFLDLGVAIETDLVASGVHIGTGLTSPRSPQLTTTSTPVTRPTRPNRQTDDLLSGTSVGMSSPLLSPRF